MHDKSNIPAVEVNAQMKREAWILIAIAVSARILFALLFANCTGSGDSGARLMIAYNMAETSGDVNLFPSITWLPLHFWLMALVLKISSFSITAVVALHILAGVLGVVNFYFLMKQVFPRYSFHAAFTLALLPVHVYLSVQTMTEVMYFLFTSVALFYRIAYFKQRFDSQLMKMSIALIGATLLRYEAWIFTAAILLSFPVFEGLKSFRARSVWRIVLSLAGCLIVMLVQLMNGEHPLAGVLNSDSFVSARFENLGANYEVFFRDTYPAIIPFMFMGLVLAWWQFRQSDTAVRIYLAIVSLPLFAFLYKFINQTIDLDDRYLINHSAYLIPLSFLFMETVWQKLLKQNLPRIAFYFPLVFCIVTYPLEHKQMTSGILQPAELFEAIDFTKKNLKGNFIIDEVNNYAEYVFLPLVRIPNQPEVHDGRSAVLHLCNVKDDVEAALIETLKTKSPDVLVLYKNSRLDAVLDINEETAERYGRTFTRVFRSGDISIYQIR